MMVDLLSSPLSAEEAASERTLFITQFDAEAGFWQYLNGLTPDGIIVELIQNDLDAHATETEIRFEADRLICQGNGDRVDADGWKRLSFMTGAGKEVPRKRNRIGVKNHGLKTCFTVGDEILIQSDRKRCKQTLYRDGTQAQPAPAAYRHPLPDESAPEHGCRIEVPYRSRPLTTGDGEPIELPSLSEPTLESMFRRACDEIPKWFFGVIRPGVRDKYRISLQHHFLGVAVFDFSCSRRHRIPGGEIFARRCDFGGNVEGTSGSISESAFLFRVDPDAVRHEVPEFYVSEQSVVCEISWRIDQRRTPVPETGMRRYPICYTGKDLAARTGLAVHYSAPFVSDLERHGAAPAALNQELSDICDVALVGLLRDYLVPRHGARTLSLLLDSSGDNSARVFQLTERLLAERAIPLASRHGKQTFGPRRTADGATRPVVVPAFSWAIGETARELRVLCPPELDQIDPALPPEIISLLKRSRGDRVLSGWQDIRVDFNELDVLDRLQPATKTAYFPWPSEKAWRRALGNPAYARTCLNVVAIAHHRKAIPDLQELRNNIHLPDTRRQVRRLSEMFLGNRVPQELALLKLPPFLHNEVAKHEIFRLSPWRPAPYTLEQFLGLIAFESEPEPVRSKFWKWVRRNCRTVPSHLWPQLAISPIWPGADGASYPLPQLCQPNDPRVGEVLAGVLHLPAKDLSTFRYLRKTRHGIVRLRQTISEGELAAFCANRLNSFPRDRALTPDEEAAFRRFERELEILSGDKCVAPLLARNAGLGTSQDHVLRPLSELHASTPTVSSSFLLPSDLLARTASRLDRVLPARPRPSSESLVRALQLNADNTEALVPRLNALRQAMAEERRSDSPLSTLECIPVGDRPFKPSELAFKGNRGDYWGIWKTRFPATGLSADIQELYRFAGVISGEPNPETSVAFLEWLNTQPPTVIAAHLEMVVRHLGNERSVRTWWEIREDLPSVAVEVGTEYRLVSLRDVRRPGSRVYLPDSEELVESIRKSKPNERVMLAVVSHQRVTKPVTQFLRSAGAQSLRDAGSSPIEVHGVDVVEVPQQLAAEFADLRSRKMANLAKRLAALDFPETYLRDQWRNRLERIKEIRLAKTVTAVFKLGGRRYSISAKSGFDEAAGVLWLRHAATTELFDVLYESVGDRIFHDAPKFAAAVLRRAVHNEFRELFIVGPESTTSEGETTERAEPESEQEHEPGEAFPLHHPTEPSREKNVPRPGPIPKALAQTPNGSSASQPSSSRPSTRTEVPLEQIQKADLKEKQYAWHCQVCLAIKTPAKLAPNGSYVELAENRQRMMEAHHVDHVGTGGARHAGNLVVLCYWHHHEVGNALTRSLITKALAENATPKTITFSTDEGDVDVKGYLVTVQIGPSGQKTAALFFTSWHREHWLSVAPKQAKETLEK